MILNYQEMERILKTAEEKGRQGIGVYGPALDAKGTASQGGLCCSISHRN
ncbi:MAG: hypothetical protein IKU09_06690 [Firmicutes bacterium]|nr:hypothetical protein [Bacillota bacterium]